MASPLHLALNHRIWPCSDLLLGWRLRRGGGSVRSRRSCGIGCSRLCGRRSDRRRSGNVRLGVIRGNNCLGDVGLRSNPQDRALLLVADVQHQGVAIHLGISLHHNVDLLHDLAHRLLQVRIVGGLGVIDVALILLLLGVDGVLARGALLIGKGGSGLELLLQRFDLGPKGVQLGLLRLILLLKLQGMRFAGFWSRDARIFSPMSRNSL